MTPGDETYGQREHMASRRRIKPEINEGAVFGLCGPRSKGTQINNPKQNMKIFEKQSTLTFLPHGVGHCRSSLGVPVGLLLGGGIAGAWSASQRRVLNPFCNRSPKFMSRGPTRRSTQPDAPGATEPVPSAVH